jgi:aminoglycoside phosphotransferase (APT) family kinase protein
MLQTPRDPADLFSWLFLDWATGPGYGVERLPGLPGRDETIGRWEELTGLRVQHPQWFEMFAALRFGTIMSRIAVRMTEVGIPGPWPDFDLDNTCTRRMAELLGLPAPGGTH